MSPRRLLVLAVAAASAALLLFPAGSAVAHGEEDEALAEAPARTLVQQALGLLTQTDEPSEAMERLEAALESEDTDRVDLASVRNAMGALERGDSEETIGHLNEALTPAEEPAEPTEEPAEPHEEEGAAPADAEEALSHTEEFEPERGTAEWIGLFAGIALVIIALGLLTIGRRTSRA